MRPYGTGTDHDAPPPTTGGHSPVSGVADEQGSAWQHRGVRFRADHRFSAPPDAVARLLADPGFYLGLDLPDVGRPELVEEGQRDGGPVLRLRYEYTGHLDPVARRLVGSRMAWTQEVAMDGPRRSGTLRFEADIDPRRFHGRAGFDLVEDGSGTRRTLEGELVVAVPGIGGMAERRIVPGVLRRLDLEAEALEARLRRPA